MTVHRPSHEAGHPGRILREEVLPALDLTVKQAARDLGITRQTLHRILAGRAAITPDMAARLEKLCGISSRFWLIRQQNHDLDLVCAKNHDVLRRIPSRRLPEELLENLGGGNV